MNPQRSLRSSRNAPPHLAHRIQQQMQRGLILGAIAAMAFAGVVLWFAMHTPINERWKANVAYALAGVWGVATLGYRRALQPGGSG